MAVVIAGCGQTALPPAPPPVAIEEAPPPPPPSATASAAAAPKPRPPLESPYERWRIAIEVFVPHATPGASIALDADRRELFAKYIAKLHERVHPIFSSMLVPLDSKMVDALSNSGLSVEVELAIDPVTGKVRKFGVARRSEVVDFDAMALDAIKEAQPFEPAPERLVSPDGSVYVRWTFRRDSNEGCSVRDAKGFVLKKAPWPP
jgi:TonB family protein